MTGTTHAGSELTPEQAASTIEQARSYEEPLRRRTEGVTWMIWGLVPAGLQLSFDATDAYGATLPGWMDPVLSLGWMAMGLLFTFAVWRIAVLDAPGLRESRWRSLLGVAAIVPGVWLVIGGVSALAASAGLDVDHTYLALVGLASAWTLLGATNPFQATPRGRRTLLAIGATMILVATLIPFSGGFAGLPLWKVQRLSLIVVAGGIPIVAGLWQNLAG